MCRKLSHDYFDTKTKKKSKPFFFFLNLCFKVIHKFSLPGESAAVEETAAGLEVAAAELTAAAGDDDDSDSAAADVDSAVDVADADSAVGLAAGCVCAAASPCPSAVTGGPGGGDGCVGAVGGNAEGDALRVTRFSAD